MSSSTRNVLAIGIDAAEASLVDRLLAAGELPVLADLTARGDRRPVSSPARIGSPWVWPTFLTGTDPVEHGVQMGWHWSAPRMAMTRPHTPADLRPWWRDLADDGTSILTLDMPFAPVLATPSCIDVAEWGAHDRIRGKLVTSPPELGPDLVREFGRHPYSRDVPPPERASIRYLKRAAQRAAAGAAQRAQLAEHLLCTYRPQLALVTFTEIHRSSHLLWQTVEPDDPVVADAPRTGLGTPVVDTLRQIDDHIGRLVDLVDDDTVVLVYALHGMRSARGIPNFLEPLLEHFGYATPARAPGRGGTRRLFAGLKRSAPNFARSAWRSFASPALAERVARPTLLLPLDWDNTSAFALPTDQHGWIRISLAGREGRGTVAKSDYGPICDDLSAMLLEQKTVDGRPLVSKVRVLPDEFDVAPHPTLPDLVIEWEDAASDDPVRIADTLLEVPPDARRLTGKHTYHGWMVSTGLELGDGPVEARDLGRVLESAASAGE